MRTTGFSRTSWSGSCPFCGSTPLRTGRIAISNMWTRTAGASAWPRNVSGTPHVPTLVAGSSRSSSMGTSFRCMPPCFDGPAVETVGAFDEDPQMVGVEDWEFLLRLADRFEADYTPDILGGCVVRPGSLSADPATRDRRRFALLDRARVRFAEQIRALGPAGRRLVADTHNWFGFECVHQRRWSEAARRLWNSVRVWPVQRKAWWALIRCLVAQLASTVRTLRMR